jgi:hypothetical protein
VDIPGKLMNRGLIVFHKLTAIDFYFCGLDAYPNLILNAVFLKQTLNGLSDESLGTVVLSSLNLLANEFFQFRCESDSHLDRPVSSSYQVR